MKRLTLIDSGRSLLIVVRLAGIGLVVGARASLPALDGQLGVTGLARAG